MIDQGFRGRLRDHLSGHPGIDGSNLGVGDTGIAILVTALSRHLAIAIEKVAVEDAEFLKPIIGGDEFDLSTIQLVRVF